VQGQESIHKVYSTNDGLISNTIYDIRQDDKGFLWIATNLGLNRFDGNRFKEFPIEGNKSSSISNLLFFDGATWVQNFKGQYFKTKNEKLVFQPQVSRQSNFSLGHDFDGKTFATLSNNKILLVNGITKKIKEIEIPQELWISSVTSSKTDFCIFNLKLKQIIRVNAKGEIKKEWLRIPLKSTYYHWLIGENDDYFVSKVEKILIEKSTGKIYDFSRFIQNSFVQNACFVGKNKIAILTTSGVILFDLTKKQFKKIFSEFSCSKLIEDQEGNWWIGTIGNGLLFIPHQEAKIYLKGIEISSMQRLGDIVFLGTKENSIYQFNVKNQQLTQLFKNIENHEVKTLFIDPLKKDFLYCNSFFNYSFGTTNFKKKLLSVNQITALDDKHYLLSESNNLTIFPVKSTDEWLKWKNKNRYLENDRLTLFSGNNRVLNAVFFQQKIVAHASDGLWVISEKFTKKIKVGSIQTDIIHIFKSKKGLIITTSDEGIFKLSNGTISKLDVLSKSLEQERLYKTKFFGNRFYALTYNGIVVTNEAGFIQQKILRSDGYPDVDVIDFEIINNTIYASTTNGFQIIPIPSEKFQSVVKPKILLNECLLNGEKINFKQKMRFLPDENNLQFDFSVINFRALGNHQLYYSNNGKKWIPINNNQLQLNELAPGNYQLKIYAVTDRIENKSDFVVLEFEVVSPFYQRWWFFILLSFFMFAIGFGVFKLRLRQIQQKNQILQEKLSLEKKLHESSLAAIKSQMNPHFLFNALNTIQSFIYTNEKEAASSYLVNFSELTRMILEMSNKPYVLLSEEIEALRLYLKLEKMRFEEDFEFEINTSALPHESFKIPSMLIQPYVENAIKHGLLHKKGNKLITLSFSCNENTLFVNVADNGIGMVASKRINLKRKPTHQSFATAANQKRFELLNQLSEGKIGIVTEDIKDTAGTICGTIVKLSIPIGK